jgi:rubrerythrin
MNNALSDAVRTTLLHAIYIEARNGGVYDTLAQLFQGYDNSVTDIFVEMAAEERQHGTLLEKLYRERFGPVPPPAEEPREVIEAPDLDDPEAFIFDSMTIVQALESGLRAEEGAREFYSREAERTPDPALQKQYRELGEFEEAHVQRLKERLAEKRRQGDSTAR